MSDLAQYPIMHACVAGEQDGDVAAGESHDRGAGRHSPRRRHLRLRAPGEADRDALVRFFEGLSPRSLFLRFHGHPRGGRTPRRAGTSTRTGSTAERCSLGVEGGEDRVVALANYVRLRDPRTRRGRLRRGRRLPGSRSGDPAARALAACGPRGIERFIGEVMADNAAMIGVFEGVGFEVSRTLERRRGGDDLPDSRYRGLRLARGGARPHGVVASLARSSKRGQCGRRGVLAARNDRGRALPKHPRGRIRGPRTRSTATASRSQACGGTRSIARFRIRSISPWSACRQPRSSTRRSPPSTRGVKALCVISAGFAEIGSEGAERQEHLLARVRAHGARLLGPNCLGISSAARG